jgi:predicted ATPase
VRTGAGLQGGRRVFVGREPELAVVSGALHAASDGRPQVVVIEGEAGIGKTALLRRCRARSTGFVVLEASGEETETNLELGIVSQLIACSPAEADPPQSRSLGTGAASTVPFAAGADLLALLGAVQDVGPVLVVLDDAHWIDTPSAAALLFALRRLHTDRVCTLIAARPAAAGAVDMGWRRFLADPERVSRIALTGLDGAEVRALASALLDQPLSAGAGERLRAHTGGHPLYVGALVAELPPRSLTLGWRRSVRARRS